jgi:putative FmdB family regulatory protein
MPTYEYKREDGTTFEVRQSINDDPLETCPETGQKVKRVLSGGGGVVYKGDGWYVTDYKNNGKSNGHATSKTDTETAPSENKASSDTFAD